jgi:hypothetical protein
VTRHVPDILQGLGPFAVDGDAHEVVWEELGRDGMAKLERKGFLTVGVNTRRERRES